MHTDASRLYLDNAATSWPKPEAVYRAVDHFQRFAGVAAGRGNYQPAEDIGRSLQQTRQRIARLVGGKDLCRVIFTFNCTDSLNLALHGLLNPGDEVVTSVAEHNSVLRPLRELVNRIGIKVTSVGVDSRGTIDTDQLRRQIRDSTRLVAVTHASNVTGTVQPMEEISAIAKSQGTMLLVDAAQTLGHVPIDVSRLRIDLLAAPGHKGLLGPLGTGFLHVGPDVEPYLRSIRQGGTGTQSDLAQQPDQLPAKFESGNLNVPGLIGLAAGLEFLATRPSESSDNLMRLTEQAISAMSDTSGVSLYSQANPCGIVSFNIAGYDPREVASLLEITCSIQVRAGIHCAPEMHRALKTLDGGGTVRMSMGHFNTSQDVARFVDAVEVLASSTP